MVRDHRCITGATLEAVSCGRGNDIAGRTVVGHERDQEGKYLLEGGRDRGGEGHGVGPRGGIMDSQQFCLKWNSFGSNLATAFSNLFKSESLSDVTLFCEATRYEFSLARATISEWYPPYGPVPSEPPLLTLSLESSQSRVTRACPDFTKTASAWWNSSFGTKGEREEKFPLPPASALLREEFSRRPWRSTRRGRWAKVDEKPRSLRFSPLRFDAERENREEGAKLDALSPGECGLSVREAREGEKRNVKGR
ncbi:hypothetical protein K0M31_012949 [Melipona bicolor]|uniref:Uncharacterized protein n=1 Tax=Melipona bicolor TaxID=60889 RepID=A0AA40FJ89_9HYME|nr:hypothetical protein K0M31_012949 [Melipona bicolor]